MKKAVLLVSLLLTITMAFAFAGCGGSEGGDETGSDEATASSAEVIEPGTVLSFEAKALSGSPVSSADIFAANKVTMINVWGTFCGPCIGEMPELEEINQKYGEKGASILGLVCDVSEEDDSCLQDALDIIKDTGVTYTSLYWNSSLDSQMSVEAIPTTIFVDSEGTVLGQAIIGADPDAYRTALDQYLGETE